jgi:hypothetical protein
MRIEPTLVDAGHHTACAARSSSTASLKAAEDRLLGLVELAPEQRQHRSHERVVRAERAVRGDDRRAVTLGQSEARAPAGHHAPEASRVLHDLPCDSRAVLALDAALLGRARLRADPHQTRSDLVQLVPAGDRGHQRISGLIAN